MSRGAEPAPPRCGRRRARPARLALAGAAVGVAAALLLPAEVAEAAAPLPTGESWGAELAISGGDDVNVTLVGGAVRLAAGSTATARSTGTLVLAPRRPAAPADTVTADLTVDRPPGTDSGVDVRGVRSDGSWSAWLPAATGRPARLPEPTTEVQARIRFLGGPGRVSPAVQRLWLTTSATGGAPPTVPAATSAPTPRPTPRPQAAAPSSAAPSSAALWDAAITAEGTGRFNDTPWNVVGGKDGDPPSAVVVPAEGPAPGRAIRFTMPAGGTRAELEPNTDNFVEGSDRWFRLSVRLAPGFPTDPGTGQVISEWKNDGTGSPPLELRVEQGRFVLGGGSGHPEGPRLFSRPVGPAITGRTTDLVVHVRFSTDPAKGTVDAWQDGRAVVTGLHPPGGTLYPGHGEGYRFSYWKIGIHRDAEITTPAVLDLTDARVGSSLASVSPPTP